MEIWSLSAPQPGLHLRASVSVWFFLEALSTSFPYVASAQIEEFFHDYNVGGIIDLNVGDGKTAMVAIKRNASLVGITYNEYHREQLYLRLESEVFREMQSPESSLYEVGLVNLLGTKKRKVITLAFWSRSL